MNLSILMGRITKDLELRNSQAGTAYMSFTVAINRKFSKQGEEKQVDFISCKAFGKTAENIAKFFKKGSLIGLEGRIQTGSYDKDGSKVYTTDVIVDSFHFTGEKKDSDSASDNDNKGFTAISDVNDTSDLPF